MVYTCEADTLLSYLQISMDDMLLMAVLYSRNNLEQKNASEAVYTLVTTTVQALLQQYK